MVRSSVSDTPLNTPFTRPGLIIVCPNKVSLTLLWYIYKRVLSPSYVSDVTTKYTFQYPIKWLELQISIMPAPQTKFKAVFFDFMGTCLDWHSSVTQSLPPSISQAEASKFALEWRRQYFIENDKRFRQNLQPEDIDNTLFRTLEAILSQSSHQGSYFDANTKKRMVGAWHSQPAWPEVQKAIKALQEDLGLEVFVHANGTTRLQLDLTRSSELNFNMLFSSQLLGVYKPSIDAYEIALQLVKLQPDEVVMVAAHAYDLRGAQKAGMKTIYIHRWTDDIDENMGQVKTEFDAFLEDMADLPSVISKMQI